ncbi:MULTISPECIES: MerR family transcriptional regulator [unclassified Streptomyces]|uniref:MerR family transcriptional regulator n=1 Tax=unclassified Streptomyces TaxID=2593676 RepID=UPI002365CADF|nr:MULTISPECIES: MerR family transcriptional regulator [unclassified Streptomyces]MDF3140592.1 MerR family transcriptional regulator [Streptomyces sp. T21Q-yed]WDF44402.1 MerR family transcriptional regulator [Streptomyces sp. T12]
MRIGEVAEQAGVSVRALRYYEEQRLLGPTRTAGGQREYQDGSVERVRMIQQLYAAGLSSRLVREVLPRCMNEGPSPVGFTDSLITERARIDRQINDLTAVRARLDEIIAVATDPHHPHHRHPIRAGVAAGNA